MLVNSIVRKRILLVPLSILAVSLFSACGGGGGGSGDEPDSDVDGGYVSDGALNDGAVSDARPNDDGSTNGNEEAGRDSELGRDSGPDGVVSPGRSDCGNGELDDGEACDDGNDQDGDGCNANCEIEACFSCPSIGAGCEECGNGIVESSEECDDGNCKDGDGCDTSCDLEDGWTCPVDGQPCEFCGNGVIEPNERCDDGNTDEGDGCAEDCRSIEPHFTCPEEGEACIECGDGVVDGDEECDDGAHCEDGTDCTDDPSECEGIGDETCAPRSGDGCVFNCTTTEPGWVCPDEGGPCSLCGDGEVNDTTEECDDGNFQSNDGCSSQCEKEAGATCMIAGILCSVCGNGYLEYTTYLGDNGTPDDPSDDFADQEECDDGNQDDNDGCDSDCEKQSGWNCPVVGMGCGICGDGIVQEIEICDDGSVCTGTSSGTLDGSDCTDDATACENDNGTCAPVSDDGCSADCVSIDPHFICPTAGGVCVECGDGVLDGDLEQCDDGNVFSGDGCNRLCRVETNLDWICVTPGQRCELCGNGINEPNEACDDGNTESGDGCAADCQSVEDNYNCHFDGYPCTLCGDGVVDVGEECDEGDLDTPANATDGCNDQCRVVYPWVCPVANAPCELCGDGIVDTIEECDDGNIGNDDGCSSTCQVEPGYDCGDGTNCVAAACGDGYPAGDEECDDGNQLSGDGCNFVCDIEDNWDCVARTDCHRTECGDGVLEGAEQCDDGNLDDEDGCDSLCQYEIGYRCPVPGQLCELADCGDGVVEGAEQCDDGDAETPGCDETCQLESGYYCPDPGGECLVTVCGDGVVQGLEACDDGLVCSGTTSGALDGTDCTLDDTACVADNGTCAAASNDGCASDCTIETFYRCEGEPSDCTTIIGFVSIRRFNITYVDPDALVYDPARRSFGGHKKSDSKLGLELCLDGTVIDANDDAFDYGTIYSPEGVGSALPDRCANVAEGEPCYDSPIRPVGGNLLGATYDPFTDHFLFINDLGGTVKLTEIPRDFDPDSDVLDEFDVILGDGSGSLSNADGLAVGEDGDLYVAVNSMDAVLVFERNRDENQDIVFPACSGVGASNVNCTTFERDPVMARSWDAETVDNLDAIFAVPGESLMGIFAQPTGFDPYTTTLESGVPGSSSEYFTFYDPKLKDELSDPPPVYGRSQLPGLLFQLGDVGHGYTKPAKASETAADGGAFIVCPQAANEGCQVFARTCQSDADCASIIPGTICKLDATVPYCHSPGDARDDRATVDVNSFDNFIDVLTNDSLSESACVDPVLRIQSVCGDGVQQQYEIDNPENCPDDEIAQGTIEFDETTGVTYDPPADTCGFIDSFTYTVDLGGGVYDTATVRVVVACICGDGIVQSNEQCDEGDASNGPLPARCSDECMFNVVCGDGYIDPGEECDNGRQCADVDATDCTGNAAACDSFGDTSCEPRNSDGCSSLCTLESICGDGVEEGVEECDNGRQCQDGSDCTDDPSDCAGVGDGSCETRGGDGCNTNCTIPTCGDGNVDLDNPDGAEQCDDGNTNPADDCTNECTLRAKCGNGIIEPPEACDDGGTSGGDGCSAQCTLENVCGNNEADPGEVCDGEAHGSCPMIDDTQIMCINYYEGAPNICLCENYCGDGSIGGDEECDDGMDGSDSCRSPSPVSGDPCTEIRCGDGIVDSDEQCDDGNTNPADKCTNNCLLVTQCGDGVKEGFEECDDNNNVSGDGCSSACKLETAICGDDILHYTEQCDDGNTDNGDGCDENCMLEGGVCGDGSIDLGEQCDDGNTTSGDGCSSLCMAELCGNGDIDDGEDCDDGRECTDGTDCTDDASVCEGIDDESCKPRSGDGCTEMCRLEII